MSAVIFALLLVATALGLERYSTVHSLDDVQGRLEVEDHLVEAGEPAVIYLVVRNSGPRWKMFLAAKLHLNKEFLPCTEHHITQDQAGWGHTVRFTTWLRPGQEADFSTDLRLERRGRYVLEPMQVIGGDFLGLVEQSRTERGFHELIVPPRECALPELEEMLGGFLGELSVNRYVYEDPILTAGYRPYTSGDPMRAIAWKQSVRGQGLMVKKWDYTTEPRAVVLVHADTKDYDHPEPAELCYSMARTVCRRLEERRCPTALRQTLPLTCCSMRPSPVRSGENRWKPRRATAPNTTAGCWKFWAAPPGRPSFPARGSAPNTTTRRNRSAASW